jgi:hypothetical protein
MTADNDVTLVFERDEAPPTTVGHAMTRSDDDHRRRLRPVVAEAVAS